MEKRKDEGGKRKKSPVAESVNAREEMESIYTKERERRKERERVGE